VSSPLAQEASVRFDVFQPDPTPCTKTVACLLDSAQKSRVVFEPIFRWLMPRLSRFRRAHSDIDVRVATSERLADFVSDGIDIAIRCGGGQYPGLTSELLMKEAHFPVCSPKLLKGRYPLRTPADLARHTLLHDVFTVDWAMWLRSARIDKIDPQHGPTFLSSDHAIQAAVRGEGVVLGRSALVGDELAAGRLVRPFELSLPASFAYYVVCPPRALKRPSVKTFRDWLIRGAPKNEVGLARHLRGRAKVRGG
jgi:LysR family glycine cleavage system transcriptional activator